MMNMGGLLKRMPRTATAFIIGGFALSGLPVVTAGFWSKDEILAQAWTINKAVFWTLAVAAGLTAFYTARQLCLTFLGEPRTEAAKHAPESVPSMTVPLLILAAFAICLGWVGIPENLPGLGGVIPNWFHHFVGSTIETGGHEAEHAIKVAGHLSEAVHEFDWAPMLIGTVFGLGGLALGGLVYGWKPMKAGEMDRVEAGMRRVGRGWLHRAMRNRFYFDDLYHLLFVRPAVGLANLFDLFDYGQPIKKDDGTVVERHGVIDGLINLAGSIGRGLSQVSDWFDSKIVDGLVNLVGNAGRLASIGLDFFDLKVVDGAVNGVGSVVQEGGRSLRPIQSGKVQNYLLVAAMMVLGLIATFFIIIFRMPN
jgi:NADH-quinone oxidoreductase subunit L